MFVGGRLVPHPGDHGGLGPLVDRNSLGPGHDAGAEQTTPDIMSAQRSLRRNKRLTDMHVETSPIYFRSGVKSTSGQYMLPARGGRATICTLSASGTLAVT